MYIGFTQSVYASFMWAGTAYALGFGSVCSSPVQYIIKLLVHFY